MGYFVLKINLTLSLELKILVYILQSLVFNVDYFSKSILKNEERGNENSFFIL